MNRYDDIREAATPEQLRAAVSSAPTVITLRDAGFEVVGATMDDGAFTGVLRRCDEPMEFTDELVSAVPER